MKVNELMEGKWVAKSKDGKERRFKNLADAEHWRNNYSKDILPAKDRFKSVGDYLDWADKEEEKLKQQRAALKPKAGEIWSKFQQAVGDSFPDGDPFDRMGPWMRQHDLTMHDLDAAVAEFNGKNETAHSYLAQMWDDHAGDAEHDALQGAHGDTYDDQWFNRGNPWK